MGTEIAVPVFGPLILIGAAILIYLAISGRRRPISESSTLGMGRSRLALGYLGVLAAAFAYSYWDTVDLSRYKVAEGHVTQAEADQYFWGWLLNLLCLVTPFIYLFLTALGLPLLKILRRIGFVSILGTLLASQAIALLISEGRARRFTNKDFRYDPVKGTCICPAGKSLYSNGSNVFFNDYAAVKFRAPKSAGTVSYGVVA
jgi:hypothetical protein